MDQRQKDLTKLKNMRHGDEEYFNWFEEGGGTVYKVYDVYVLFESPQYGGEDRYEETYFGDDTSLNKLLDTVYSWT